MANVKNEEKTVATRTLSDRLERSEALKLQGFSVSDESGSKAARCAGSPGAAPDLEPGHPALGDVAGVLYIIAMAVLLTYGNVIMEAFFRLLGI